MSGPFGSSPWGYNPGGGGFYSYSIDQSLRFEDEDSAHLYRTTSRTPSSTTSTVFSCWVKRSKLGAIQMIWTAATTAPSVCGYVYFNASDQIQVYLDKSAAESDELNTTTTAVFRDVSSWYHIAVVYNTADSTTANKSKIYVNGVQQAVSTSVTGSAVTTHRLLDNGVVNTIGKSFNSSSYFDGYLAEFHVVDGVSGIDYDDFGETKDGVWVAKSYSGGHGDNGYYLPFDDSSAIGDDESSNTNDFTVSGLVASDVVPDSPTNNFATWNPLINTTQTLTFKEGNLNLAASSQSWAGSGDNFNQSTIGVLGGSNAKHYFEFTMESNTSGSYVIGVGRHNSKGIDTTHYTGGVVFYNTRCSSDSTDTVTGITRVASLIIIRVAFDASNGKVWIGDNNGYFNSGDPANGTGEVGTISGYDGETLVAILNRSTNAGNQIVNFGQDSTFANRKTTGSADASDANGIGDFYYAPPSGFLALCSANLSEPEIIDGSDYFNTVLWTGNGASSRAISGVGFSPDWVWAKQRGQDISHVLYDSVRGAGNDKELVSNSTGAEGAGNQDQYGYLSSFDSDGFTGVDGTGSPNYYFNENSQTFVAWNWLAGTSFSNSAGANGATIATTGQVNTKAGFSIVSYTGTATSGSFKHGLLAAPQLVINKNLIDVDQWSVYSEASGTGQKLALDTTGGDTATSNYPTTPTASIFYVGAGQEVNGDGDNMIAYCFHSVDGYSKVGSYTGSGSTTSGTFVYTGFRPAWVLIKCITSGSTNWLLLDNKREGYNSAQDVLFAESTADEETNAAKTADFLSNGFKVAATTNVSTNASGKTYIYLAFAENPFKYANAR